MKHNLNHSWNTSQYSKTSDLQASASDELIENLQIKPDENVLDIGCGIGNITMNLASIAYRGHVMGIDDSSSMINQANKNLFSGSLPNISFQVMSATELDFNRQFDVVFSNSVFHWIKNQEKILQAIHKSLKSGGRLGVQFPLLDEFHPMISLVNMASRHLSLENYYEKREFPWFVPESVYKYTVLLNQFDYKNVIVREVETYYIFNSTLSVINFFKAVGLDILLEPLSGKDRILLENELINLLVQQNNANGIRLGFHRLYVYADRS